MGTDQGHRRVAVAYWRDGGTYPRATTGGLGDPYLRAIAVMAATLRRFAPDVAVEVHTNLDGEEPELAASVNAGAAVVATPFEHQMPDGYFQKFSASTYSIDVLAALARSSDGDSVSLLVDPDLVWLRDPSPLFDQASRAGLVSYQIPYPADFLDLGMTRRKLSDLSVEMTGRPLHEPDGLIAHLGGELLGGTRHELERFSVACSELWDASVDRFEAGVAPWLNTEEHVYSAAFHALGYTDEHTTTAVRRTWTRPGRLRNIRSDDTERIAWHALSEKGRGLDRLHSDSLAAAGAFEPAISDDEFRLRLSRALAIHPSIPERASFGCSRLYARARGRRLGPMPA